VRRAILILSLVAAAACSGSKEITGPSPVIPGDTAAPALDREMRGLWIATVANIDWPSLRTLSATQQKAELIDILDRAKSAGLNTIVLQVRPAGDAVYESALEPWASLLTGAQGGNPGYDPLAFAITEAHARGFELHAWINPFRAGNTSDTATMVAPHLFRTRRDLIRVYAGNIWMDPGEPDVHDRSMSVILDIVRRYDIDGIHADDYFYPYVVNDNTGKPIPFPDDATFAKYGAGLSLADWRRANIDRFVERMYREVHAIKPTIKVGISPFGIWRPGNPVGITDWMRTHRSTPIHENGSSRDGSTISRRSCTGASHHRSRVTLHCSTGGSYRTPWGVTCGRAWRLIASTMERAALFQFVRFPTRFAQRESAYRAGATCCTTRRRP
jgi:uncharacterized lipoprotein YddW (UPF0748 family)